MTSDNPTPQLVKRTDLIEWSDDQLALIKRTVAKDCTADETKLFLYQCARTGLDPLARQIYAVKRSGKMTIQTGIDGYRLVADRTGKYAGSDDAIFAGAPMKDLTASVTIYKVVSGIRCPFSASARWTEYYPGDSQGTMWKKMPHTMLAKCAEALALRKAFPADLSGVYTAEEMDQAGVVEAVSVTPQKQLAPAAPEDVTEATEKAPSAPIAKPADLPAAEALTDMDILRISDLAKRAGFKTRGELTPILREIAGVESLRQFPKKFLDELTAFLEQKGDAAMDADAVEVFGTLKEQRRELA